MPGDPGAVPRFRSEATRYWVVAYPSAALATTAHGPVTAVTSSLSRTAATWFSTVRGEMNNRSAISLVVRFSPEGSDLGLRAVSPAACRRVSRPLPRGAATPRSRRVRRSRAATAVAPSVSKISRASIRRRDAAVHQGQATLVGDAPRTAQMAAASPTCPPWTSRHGSAIPMGARLQLTQLATTTRRACRRPANATIEPGAHDVVQILTGTMARPVYAACRRSRWRPAPAAGTRWRGRHLPQLAGPRRSTTGPSARRARRGRAGDHLAEGAGVQDIAGEVGRPRPSAHGAPASGRAALSRSPRGDQPTAAADAIARWA